MNDTAASTVLLAVNDERVDSILTLRFIIIGLINQKQ